MKFAQNVYNNSNVNNILTKSQLENIFNVYRFCLQAHQNHPDKDILNEKFSSIVSNADNYIRDFANGKLQIEDDALDLMRAYIDEFGKNYYRQNGKLVYQFSDDASKAKLRLSQLDFYRQKNNMVTFTPQTSHCYIDKAETRKKVETPKVKTQKAKVKTSKKAVFSPSQTHALKNAWMSACDKFSSKIKNLFVSQKNKTQKTVSAFREKIQNINTALFKKVKNCGIASVAAVGMSAFAIPSTGVMSVQNFSDRKFILEKNAKEISAQIKTPVVAAKTDTLMNNVPQVKTPVVAANTDTLMNNVPQVKTPVVVANTDTYANNISQYNSSFDVPVDTSTYKNNIAFYDSARASQNNILSESVSSVTQQNSDTLNNVQIAPYSSAFADVLKQNKEDYKDFAQRVAQQFKHNIELLKSSNYGEKVKFYREQGKYFTKIGKPNYIIPNKSCESMSNATLLSVSYQEQQNNYIQEACKDVLKEIPNPHACYSSLKTLGTQKTHNLGKTICQIFDKNPNAIVAAWIHNSKGGKHRISFVGTGDGNAYMMSYNNDRIMEISEDNLGWLNHLPAEYHNLSENIIRKANELAIEDAKKKHEAERSKTLFLVNLAKAQKNKLLSVACQNKLVSANF